MAAIRALLNPTASTSNASGHPNTNGNHQASPRLPVHDPYDRAQEIALATHRSMTPIPTTILNTVPPPLHTVSSAPAPATYHDHRDNFGDRKRKPKPKRLASPSNLTTTQDIHYRRLMSPSPSPSLSPSVGVTPTPSRAGSPITTGSPYDGKMYTPTEWRSASPAGSDMTMTGGGGVGLGVSGISGEESPRKKPKIVKDAPVFVKGPIRGAVRYTPKDYSGEAEKLVGEVGKGDRKSVEMVDVDAREESDGEGEVEEVNSSNTTTTLTSLTPRLRSLIQSLPAYHDQFALYPPQSDIASYPRFIPYNSERRIFADATGRDFFEVFQYEFKVPDRDERPYTMLWDYNVGLVRTTPLFKCCGYGKTTPAKMLNRNVGLREICHSITGGALVAQGYWMPYEAAKAVAATFCWAIRYALTPVFGIDFIDMCVPPDSDKFGVMMIDPKITKLCTEQAKMYKQLEVEQPHARPVSGMPSPRTPLGTPLTPKFRPLVGGGKFTAINAKDGGGSESGCGSGGESEASDEVYMMSPGSPSGPYFRQVGWKGGEMPRSAPRTRSSQTPSPKTITLKIKARRERDDDEEYVARVTGSSKRGSPAASVRARKEDLRMMGLDESEGYDGNGSEMDIDKEREVVSLRYHAGQDGMEDREKKFGTKDAAKALLELMGEVQKAPKRRASA